MIVIRKRFIFWLLKAYIKKSGKMMLISFFIGLCVFFAILFGARYYTRIFPVYEKSSIGLVGVYTQDNLPLLITEKFSRGLTKIASDGSIYPDLADHWEIKDGGKTYLFHLKQHEYFSNGVNVTSDKIRYNFSDVKIERPDKYTIIYTLKDSYVPFLVTLSKGVFEQGYIGVGDYQLKDIQLNGNFVHTLTMISVKNELKSIKFQFYPTEEALKLAFLLGEISEAHGITDITYKKTSFAKFPNTKVKKIVDSSQLVTLFYNTNDNMLSDKKMRLALSYALPNTFVDGKRAFLPYPRTSLYYNNALSDREQDYDHARLLLTPSGTGHESAKTVTIKTLKKYRVAAESIVRA
jgi:ABC-type transport system substrate-binding protein